MAPDATAEAAEVSAEIKILLSKVCQIPDAPRSTIYDRPASGEAPRRRPSPMAQSGDEDFTGLISLVIVECPFAGEGRRKVRCCPCREHDLALGKRRVLRMWRARSFLAPQRVKKHRLLCLHDDVVIALTPMAPGAPIPPSPGPETTSGCGCWPHSSTTDARPGPSWLWWTVAYPPSNPFSTPSSTGLADYGHEVGWGIKLRHDGAATPDPGTLRITHLAGHQRRRHLHL